MILSLTYPRVFFHFISLSSAIWLVKNMSLTAPVSRTFHCIAKCPTFLPDTIICEIYLLSPLSHTSFQVRGYPEPQITWYRNGHPVPEGDHYVVDRGIRGVFSLVIKGVQEGDGGKYTCEAANDGGVRQVTVELTVEGKKILTLPLWWL